MSKWQSIDQWMEDRAGVATDNGGTRLQRRPDRPAYAGVLPPDVAAAAQTVQAVERTSPRRNPRLSGSTGS